MVIMEEPFLSYAVIKCCRCCQSVLRITSNGVDGLQFAWWQMGIAWKGATRDLITLASAAFEVSEGRRAVAFPLAPGARQCAWVVVSPPQLLAPSIPSLSLSFPSTLRVCCPHWSRLQCINTTHPPPNITKLLHLRFDTKAIAFDDCREIRQWYAHPRSTPQLWGSMQRGATLASDASDSLTVMTNRDKISLGWAARPAMDKMTRARR